MWLERERRDYVFGKCQHKVISMKSLFESKLIWQEIIGKTWVMLIEWFPWLTGDQHRTPSMARPTRGWYSSSHARPTGVTERVEWLDAQVLDMVAPRTHWGFRTLWWLKLHWGRQQNSYDYISPTCSWYQGPQGSLATQNELNIQIYLWFVQ